MWVGNAEEHILVNLHCSDHVMQEGSLWAVRRNRKQAGEKVEEKRKVID